MPEYFDPQTGDVMVEPLMPKEVAAAIVAVTAKIKALGYNEKNPHGGYPYVSVDKFYALVGPLMAENNLFLWIDEVSSDVREGSSGKPWLFVRYAMRFAHASGAMSPPVYRSLAQAISGPQAFGAAQSYIEKQFLRQVFKVPTGEKDADVEPTTEVVPVRQVPRMPQTAPQPAPEARTAPQRPLGMLSTRNSPSLASAAQNGTSERDQLRDDLQEMHKAIAEADKLGLAAIRQSDDWTTLQADLKRVLGDTQGEIQVKQLFARVDKRLDDLLPSHEV